MEKRISELEKRIEKLEKLEERRQRNLQEMIVKNEEAQRKYEKMKATFL